VAVALLFALDERILGYKTMIKCSNKGYHTATNKMELKQQLAAENECRDQLNDRGCLCLNDRTISTSKSVSKLKSEEIWQIKSKKKLQII